jgi:hypothetical protein
MTTINEVIAAGADDGFVFTQSFTPTFANYTAAIVTVGANVTQDPPIMAYAGARFQTINLAPPAIIDSATFTYPFGAILSGTPLIDIHGHDIDDATAWPGDGSLIPFMPQTAAVVALNTATGASANDVTAIVQEIVDRGGWAANNDMAFGLIPLDRTGIWQGVAYESSFPPTLDITYRLWVKGTIAATETADTMAASGLENMLGPLAATETADTMAAAGLAGIRGPLAATESADTMSGAGLETVTGTLTATESADTMAATGQAGIRGALAATETNDTMAASGLETISGAVAATETADTMAATGLAGIRGSSSMTEANDTMSAAGLETMTGALAATEANDTMSADGQAGIRGALAATEANDTMSATGETNIIAVLRQIFPFIFNLGTFMRR